MAAVINTNISSLNSQRNLTTSQSSLATSLQRLSSGLRINSAKDDAAGLAISQRMTSQINGLNRAAQNANDGVSLAQTAEGALGQVGDSLQRIRELANQSANATNSSSDRAAMQQEVSQLVSEITRISNTTSFNGLKILDGSYANQQYQIGANAGETISVSVADSRAEHMGATTLSSGTATVASGVDTTGTPGTPGTNGVDGIAGNADDVAAVPGTPKDFTGGLVLNGTDIDTTSAKNLNDVVNAINAQSGNTGVTAARAISNTLTSTAVVAAAAADSTIKIGTASISILTGDDAATIAEKVNSASSNTGVSAEVDSAGKIKLTSANGADFKLTDTADVLEMGATAETSYEAGITLSAKVGGTITVVNGATGTLAADLGLTAATGAAKDLIVSNLDISTVGGANDALAIVDAALTQVSGTRAQLGAVQNRFTAVIANLSTTAENLTASRSRIQDADFASETANMTRGQILQQAGTAMLAQANSLPNGVLALLRG